MIVGGSGSRLIDSSGRSYLDTRNNVAHCGHQNPHIISTIQQQLGMLNTNTRYLHPNATRLASRLASLLPDPLEIVFLVNSGSEANDLALRLARAYTQSKNMIVVDRAYHGHTLGTLEVSPYKFDCSGEFQLTQQQRQQKDHLLNNDHVDAMAADKNDDMQQTPGPHVWKVPCPDTYRGPHKGQDAAKLYASYVQEACRVYTEERNEKVGAFIVEGGMSVAGVILPPPAYLKICADAVRDAGGVYIADEVQTGFGRLGSCFWAFQYKHCNGTGGNLYTDQKKMEVGQIYDGNEEETTVIPDIVTVGKPFGNGMPLAAVITTRRISDAFEAMGVEYFNTFGGNPVCSAAGLAMLDTMEAQSLQQNAVHVGGYVQDRFRELKKDLSIIGDVRGSGLFVGIELVRDRETLEPATAETSYLCTILKEKYAVLTSIDGPHNNVLVVKPPMVFSVEDVDCFVQSFENAVKNDLGSADDLKNISKTPT